MKKNDMMLWLSKGVRADEAIKLSNAGFTPDMLDESKEQEEPENKEQNEPENKEQDEPEKKEPKKEEPVKKEEPKTDPKDSEIEKLQKQIAELQKSNRHQDFSGGKKAKSDLEIAKEIAAELF